MWLRCFHVRRSIARISLVADYSLWVSGRSTVRRTLLTQCSGNWRNFRHGHLVRVGVHSSSRTNEGTRLRTVSVQLCNRCHHRSRLCRRDPGSIPHLAIRRTRLRLLRGSFHLPYILQRSQRTCERLLRPSETGRFATTQLQSGSCC